MGGKSRHSRVFLALLVGWISLLAVGCRLETRYRVLTFFFEGVPPPGAPRAAVERPEGESGLLANPVSFHAAFREGNCEDCHIDRKRFLRTPIPQLCWECHDQPTESAPWDHAPARVGDCMTCHSGHETMTPALLIAQGPSLCYSCHRDTYIQGLPDHEGVSLDTCRTCHPAHEGGTLATPMDIERIADTRQTNEPIDQQKRVAQGPGRYPSPAGQQTAAEEGR
jgi:predicted CXXCH cytochrome family protein